MFSETMGMICRCVPLTLSIPMKQQRRVSTAEVTLSCRKVSVGNSPR
jgi:hypothetical protein